MIPAIPTSALPDIRQLDVKPETGRTYRLDLSSGRISGMTDGLEAVTQMVYKTLCTERFAYLIYNWGYGVELEQYLGKNTDFVMADIAGAIAEALSGDERVLSVSDFKMEKSRVDTLSVEFTVISSKGNARIGMEVPL